MFDQDLRGWDVSSVTDFEYMFYDLTFNEPTIMLDKYSILSSVEGTIEWFNQDPEPQFIYD